jgi:ATP-dependent Clp protease protease subunit
MATILLCAGAKGKRLALPNSTIHMHPAGVGQIGGYAPDVEIQARELLRMQSKIRQIMADHTGQPLERIAHDFDRDMYLDAKQALDYGIIDEVVSNMAAAIEVTEAAGAAKNDGESDGKNDGKSGK